MKYYPYSLLCCLFTLIAMTACHKDEQKPNDDTPPPNETELITAVKLIFNDSATGAAVDTCAFNDPDGNGGIVPTIDTLHLAPHSKYKVRIVLLDVTKNPVDSISNDVAEEANEHAFFFHFTNFNAGAGITVTYKDFDSNTPPLPLGLSTIWSTGNAGSGKSQILLKHQPGVKNGLETPGETDVDVQFPTVIK